MDSALQAIWWVALLAWIFASKSDTRKEVEALRQQVRALMTRAQRVDALAQRLKTFERIAMLAHLAVREAREARGGVRAPPSELEKLLASNLCNIGNARQEAEALQDEVREWDRM